METMKTLLIVTQLDYQYFSNTRTHHMVDQFRDRFAKITVIYKAHMAGETLGQRIRSFFTVGIREYGKDPVSLIEVSPLFHAHNGLGLSLLGISNPYALPPSLLKRFLRRVFSAMGFIIETAILPSLILGYLLKDRAKYDVFIGEGVWAIAMGYILKKTGRVRLLVSDDYDYSPGSQPISRFRQWYTNLIEVAMLRRSDLVFSVGSLLAGLRKSQTGKPVEVVPNGVKRALFGAGRKKAPHPPTLIYIGAVEGWSGLDIVIEALSGIRDKIRGIRLIVIGHGPSGYVEELRGLAARHGVEENVEFRGVKKYSELPACMSEADIGLSVYMPIELRKYAFSLKVIEYMSAGLPVIATRGTESGLLLDESGAGLSVDYTPLSVEKAILRLLGDRGFYDECARRALATSAEYDWKSIMKRCYSLIEMSYESLHQT